MLRKPHLGDVGNIERETTRVSKGLSEDELQGRSNNGNDTVKKSAGVKCHDVRGKKEPRVNNNTIIESNVLGVKC